MKGFTTIPSTGNKGVLHNPQHWQFRGSTQSPVLWQGVKNTWVVHLCLKVNKTLRKCHVNWVCGMPEVSVTMKMACVSGKLYNHWRFSTPGDNEGAGKRITRCHSAQGGGLCQTVQCREVERGLRCTRFA